LAVLYWKHTVLAKQPLYVAFVDLKSAFDLVPREKLWVVLYRIGVPSNLVSLLKRLHEETYAQVRWGNLGELTDKIPINRGVRQGCVL
ncbi:hypothetical protein NDU88_000003, partial [Pleurodeles waltl]